MTDSLKGKILQLRFFVLDVFAHQLIASNYTLIAPSGFMDGQVLMFAPWIIQYYVLHNNNTLSD